jgi:hypothetical protein
VIEHPKLLNPTSPKNKKQIFGINSIKEENAEESLVYPEFVENKNKNNNVEEKNNKLRINKLKEERDHSTSVSSNPQISNSKSNISTKDMCKKVDKNDDTPINDENLFQITPHFWNENTYNSNKHSIQLKLKDKKPNEEKNNKKTKFSRPLTPNLNIIRKVCIPITKKEEKIVNKDNKLIDNILIKNKDKDNKRIETTEDIKAIMEKKLSKRIGKDKDIIKTDHSVRKRSFSYTKNKILKNSKNINTNISINENEINKNMQNHQIIKYYNNYKIKNNNKIPNVNQSNCYSNNNIPFTFNNNRSLLTKNKNNTNSKNSMQKKTKRKNTSMPSHRGSTNIINSNRQNKKYIRNFSRQKKNEVYANNGLKPFKSENKIRIVHSKVNNEINNLFKGISDNIAKDPEVHNKIENLIKDIKDIKQVVLRKTQSNFRPGKQILEEYKNVENIC